MDAAHRRHVDHESAVVHSVAGGVVTTGVDREHESVVAREVDRVHDVGGAAALHDQRGPRSIRPFQIARASMYPA